MREYIWRFAKLMEGNIFLGRETYFRDKNQKRNIFPKIIVAIESSIATILKFVATESL